MKTRWIAVSLIASFVTLGGSVAAKPDAEPRSPVPAGEAAKHAGKPDADPGSKAGHGRGKGGDDAPGLARANDNRREAARAIHERRMAKLDRARARAQKRGREDLIVRIDGLVEKEKARHARHMSKLTPSKKKDRS